MKEIRDRLASPVGAVVDGIDYWGMFATCLVEQYEKVDGVVRVNRHPLSHYWTIGNITVQLKSDTGNLPLDQLTIPGVHKGATTHHLPFQHRRGPLLPSLARTAGW